GVVPAQQLQVLQVGDGGDVQAQIDPSRGVGAGLDLDGVVAVRGRRGRVDRPLHGAKRGSCRTGVPVVAGQGDVEGGRPGAVFQRLQAGEEGRGAGATQEPNGPLQQAGPVMV